MQLFAFPLESRDPVEAFACCHDQPYSLFFDSADRAHPAARYSFIAYHPFETIEAKDGRVTVTNRDQQLSFRADPFAILKDRLAGWSMNVPPRADLPPFQGGAAGFFGYDLAQGLEKLPALPSSSTPDMAVGLYDQVAAFDHAENKAWLLVLAADRETAEIKHAHFLRLTHCHPERSEGFQQSGQEGPSAPLRMTGGDPAWMTSFTRPAYEQAVAAVIDYIHAGDIFQANLSQRFDAQLPPDFDSFAHYRRLRAVNPAPFAAYMNFGGLRLASASPEQFLRVRGGHVETKPIKGTRPRSADARTDAAQARDLLASDKDRAENIMIVDLLRNDISKVCDDFSVEVPKLCALESFASVHHLVSTVTGALKADQTPVDLLRACFPGGSITGAPKVRAMEIIAELEGAARGPYCGAMGYIGFNGAMDTGIAIRTLIYEGSRVSFSAGGGITAESDPAAEYQETLDKASAIFKSFLNAEHAGHAETTEKSLRSPRALR
jgi:para-aminobenzoate synthetase component I